MTVAEGSDVHFQVEIANKDIDKLRWEKNGRPLHMDGSRKCATSSGQTFSLLVREVNKDDEATYSCAAGSAKSIARLYVEGMTNIFIMIIILR